MKELDIVILNRNIEEYNLKKGDTGTVVYVYEEGREVEVEFMTNEGKTLAVLTLLLSDLSRLDIKNTSEEYYKKYKFSIKNDSREFSYVYRNYI